MAQAEPFEPDLGHASEGTGRHFRQFCAIACSHFIQHARISLVSGGPVILPAFTQGIYGRLRQQAGADWQAQRFAPVPDEHEFIPLPA